MSAILPNSNLDDACLVAHTWGFDDALSDIRPNAAKYFHPDSPQWDAYYTGYAEGIAFLFKLTGKRNARQLGIETTRPNESVADAQERYGHLYY